MVRELLLTRFRPQLEAALREFLPAQARGGAVQQYGRVAPEPAPIGPFTERHLASALRYMRDHQDQLAGLDAAEVWRRAEQYGRRYPDPE
jgi:hypothetical protein